MQMKNKRSIYIISIIVLNIILDQASKIWVRINITSNEKLRLCDEILLNPHFDKLSITPYSNHINIISDYFILRNVENFGAFLGLGSCLSENARLLLLIILPVAVLITVIVYVFKDKSIDKLSLVGFSSIIGGGLGNIYDRIVYGSVTDFLYIDLGGIFQTGIFNIADLSVTTGMTLILWASFKNKK